MKKKKRKIKVWPIITILVVICIIIFGICIKDLYYSLKNNSAKEVKVLQTIEGYGYSLNENDSKYVKNLFKELQTILDTEPLDEEKYASVMSQIFIADFYSLNDAVNKNDVGGKQFVYAGHQDEFVKKAKASVYQYVENNIYGNRKQELPVVKTVEVIDVETSSYKTDVLTDSDAYLVDVSITYEKDLGYPSNATLFIVHSNDKLEIAELKK